MNALSFSPEHHIQDTDLGFLALAGMIITQAVEDVRLYLMNPDFGPRQSRERANDARSRADIRATEAHAAARYLQSEDCKELCEMLAACGHPVPMQRFFRELKALQSPSLTPP